MHRISEKEAGTFLREPNQCGNGIGAEKVWAGRTFFDAAMTNMGALKIYKAFKLQGKVKFHWHKLCNLMLLARAH
ncbi:MAG: hypothetical protein CL676_01915 [Bdellovibrionaceae bacterium]|nr:hypothetical protein [Pseudobdellovibrionaceae bacterium]